jgi:hypothetical protein
MDKNNEQLVISLREKLKQIISLLEVEKNKRRNCEQKNIELEENLKKIIQEKEKIAIQYNNLKLAKNLEVSETSSHDAKLKVNRIVREIDKCIALLNK